MWRVLFLILVVTSSVTFAQTEKKLIQEGETKSFKFEQFGKVSVGRIKTYMEMFFKELKNNTTAQGYIINYGSDKGVMKREKILRNHIVFRRFDTPRITFVRGGEESIVITELWIVPEGAEPPTP